MASNLESLLFASDRRFMASIMLFFWLSRSCSLSDISACMPASCFSIPASFALSRCFVSSVSLLRAETSAMDFFSSSSLTLSSLAAFSRRSLSLARLAIRSRATFASPVRFSTPVVAVSSFDCISPMAALRLRSFSSSALQSAASAASMPVDCRIASAYCAMLSFKVVIRSLSLSY